MSCVQPMSTRSKPTWSRVARETRATQTNGPSRGPDAKEAARDPAANERQSTRDRLLKPGR